MSSPDPDPHVEFSTNATYAENVPSGAERSPPGARGFFERIKDVVGEEWFKEFDLDTFRKQSSRVRTLGDQGTNCWGSWDSKHWLEYRTQRAHKLTATDRPERAVIVIEDISEWWVEILDTAFGVDPLFVLAYAERGEQNPRAMEGRLRDDSHPLMVDGNLFSNRIKGEWAVISFRIPLGSSDWDELVNSHPTHAWWYQKLGQYRRSRSIREVELALGCCRLDENTYLITVDSPPNGRFPREKNVMTPVLSFSRLHLMPWALKAFPKGPWFDLHGPLIELFEEDIRESQCPTSAFDLIFGLRPTRALPPPREPQWRFDGHMEFRLGMMVRLLRPLAWAANVTVLREKLETQRYAALLSPSGVSYRPLITLRRAVADTRAGIVAVQESIWPTMEETFQELHGDPERTLRGMHEPVLRKIDGINRELNEDIQLIIGAVTIQDSEAMKMQAERATLLTLLAAIYLPLTLVTGIFGMNIKEINDGSPSFKACVQALVVAAVATSIFVLNYSQWKRWQKVQEQLHREKEVAERRDFNALFGMPPEGTSDDKIGRAFDIVKRSWEKLKDAVMSKIVRRKREASSGASIELGQRLPSIRKSVARQLAGSLERDAPFTVQRDG